jgi:hypothetical protein
MENRMAESIYKFICEESNKIATKAQERIFSFMEESQIKIQEQIEKNDAILGRVEANLMEINAKSQNGTWYDEDWYAQAIQNNVSFNDRIGKKLILGELDHPDKPGTSARSSAFALIKIWRDSNIVKGILEIFNTTTGRELWVLIKAGVCIGFSLRGVGSDKYENGVMKIEGKNFDLKGWDAVVDPSFVIAKINGYTEDKRNNMLNILKEGNEVLQSAPIMRMILESVQNKITEEKKDKVDKFENQQLKMLVESKSKILDDSNKRIKDLELRVESKVEEVNKMTSNAKELSNLLKQKDLMLESKQKSLSQLNDEVNTLKNNLKVITEELNDQKLVNENLKTNLKTNFITEDKVEVFINKLNKKSARGNDTIGNAVASRQYTIGDK